MPSIVIAGSGPVGLATAIMLKQKYGEAVDVTVIDSNLDRYDRPGIIAVGARDAIESMGISDLDVIEQGSPPAIQIRDLQQALKQRAAESGVILEKTKYKSIAGKMIITDPAVPHLNCDLLIDCTGERREIMSQLHVPTKTLGNNPMKNHFVAYITMNEENADKMIIANNSDITIEDLREFQAQTGWNEFVPPWIDTPRKWTNIGQEGTDNAVKFCLYFEIPEHIAKKPELYEPYVRALLKLKTGENITFVSSTERGGFGPFEVQPQKLTEFIVPTESFPVVALGDSMMSAEYHLGTGVLNGVSCANKFVQSLGVYNSEISINKQQWKFEPIYNGPYAGLSTNHVIANHQKNIEDLYETRRHEIAIGTNAAYDEYSSRSNEQIDPAYLLSMAIKLQTIAQDPLMLILDKEETSIRAAQAFMRYHAITQDPNILNLLTDNYFKSPNGLINIGKNCTDSERRIRLYECALEVANTCRPDSAWEEKIKLLTNIGVQHFKLKQYHESARFLEQAHALAIRHSFTESATDLSLRISKARNNIPAAPVPSETTTDMREEMQENRAKTGDKKQDSTQEKKNNLGYK